MTFDAKKNAELRKVRIKLNLERLKNTDAMSEKNLGQERN